MVKITVIGYNQLAVLSSLSRKNIAIKSLRRIDAKNMSFFVREKDNYPFQLHVAVYLEQRRAVIAVYKRLMQAVTPFDNRKTLWRHFRLFKRICFAVVSVENGRVALLYAF